MNHAFEMRKSVMKINFKLSIKKIQILSPEAKFRLCLNITFDLKKKKKRGLKYTDTEFKLHAFC